MSDNQRPVAYTGDKPYIFVSYCRADSERVFPFILALQERYNVWYDEGIRFGEAWDEEIAQRLDDCAGFLFMVTAQSVNSLNCKDELHLARESEKNFINILMDSDFKPPQWFRLRFGRYQSCKLFEYISHDRAVAALTEKSRWLKGIEKTAEPREKKPVQKLEVKPLKLEEMVQPKSEEKVEEDPFEEVFRIFTTRYN